LAFERFGAGAFKGRQMLQDENDFSQSLDTNLEFRRFLLERSLEILSPNATKPLDNPTTPVTEKSVPRSDSATRLGPFLFLEFCEFVHSSTTSATPTTASAGGLDTSSLSLSNLSLDGFLRCVQEASFSEYDPSSTTDRVGKLLKRSIREASQHSSFDNKSHWYPSKNNDDDSSASNVELEQLLQTFILPIGTEKSENKESNHKAGILSELLATDMDRDASTLCKIVACAASTITDPNARCRIGMRLLQSWDVMDTKFQGPLGLGKDPDVKERPHLKMTERSCPSSAACAILLCMNLAGGMDGDTCVPHGLMENAELHRESNASTNNDLVAQRLRLSLPTMVEKNKGTNTKLDATVSTNIRGVVMKLASALFQEFGIGANFQDSVKQSEVLSADADMGCIQAICEARPKELGMVTHAMSKAMDTALTDADFVLSKLQPFLSNSFLELSRKFISGRLLGVSRAIRILSPFAEFVDNTSTFATVLLKNCKRLYGIQAKHILSHTSQPMGLIDMLNRHLLKEITTRVSPRVMNLLLTVQEKSKIGGDDGRLLADSKIESQGRVASQLVFEKEKSDNALLKMSSKLKLQGNDRESTWIENQVVTSISRDFRIDKKKIKTAQESETKGKKRKEATGDMPATQSSKKEKKKKKSKPKNKTPSIGTEHDSNQEDAEDTPKKRRMIRYSDEEHSDDEDNGSDGYASVSENEMEFED